MKKVCFFTHPSTGHVFAATELIEELVANGDEVDVYSSDRFKEKIISTGANYVSYKMAEEGGDGNIDEYLDNLVDQSKKRLNNLQNQNSTGLDAIFPFFDQLCKFYKNIEQRMLESIVNQKYNYIIHDACCPLGKWIGKFLNLPSVCIMSNHVFKTEMLLADPSLFLRVILEKNCTALSKEQCLHQTNRFLHIMDSILKSRYNFDEDFSSLDVIVNEEKLNLVYSSEEIQPFGDKYGDNYIFIGPAMGKTVQSALKVETPNIHISFSTVMGEVPKNVFKVLMDVLKEYPITVYLSLGNRFKIEDLGIIPPNFIVSQFFDNQKEILKCSTLFITHGGSSVNYALYYDVPILTIGFDNSASDHRLICEQLKRTQVGRHINQGEFSQKAIEENLKNIFENYGFYKLNASRVGERLKSCGGVKKALNEISRFLIQSENGE